MRNGVPNLGALQAFEATARLGSFSRAAEALSLTHSAVYRQVAGLEASLGVQLFTRVRRRVSLTAAGAQYAARVRHHLDQLEKDTFGLISQAALGRNLHIAVLPTLATTWLLPRLTQFRQQHGDIAVSLSSRTLPFQFADHPYDGAIYHAPQPWPQTYGFKLFDEKELVPVCAPSLLETIGNTRRAGAAPVPAHLHMMSRPDAWRLWYETNGLDYSPAVAAGPRYELFTMTLAAARSGLGVALIPRFLADEELASGQLALAFKGTLPVREAYFFGYPGLAHGNDALRAFESWLRGQTN